MDRSDDKIAVALLNRSAERMDAAEAQLVAAHAALDKLGVAREGKCERCGGLEFVSKPGPEAVEMDCPDCKNGSRTHSLPERIELLGGE